MIKHMSITLRLTLLFSLASSSVLLILGLLIGASVERHFEEQDFKALDGTFTFVSKTLGHARTAAELEAISLQLSEPMGVRHGVVLAIVNAKGKVPMSADGLDVPPRVLDASLVRDNQQLSTWKSRKGEPLRGQARAIATRVPGQPSVIVVAATDITHHQHFMHAFGMTLWSFVLLAAVVMGLFGWLAVRYGLAPLQAIRRETENISAHRLETRLSVDQAPAELVELVRSLNDMLARLEASFQRLSEFSSDLAHELRTPVSALLTQTQVTLSRPRTLEEYRDILASNSEEFERLGRMISDMLFLAKSDNHQLIPQRETVDLMQEVALLFEFYEALAEARGIKLHSSGHGLVSGDRLMLRRALSNVLSNAIRHGADESDIAMHIEQANDGSTSLSLENMGQTIAHEHLPRLFDRFYRVDAARQRFSDGAGLGLAITRSIMRSHGGDATVSSDNGRTVFELTMPPTALITASGSPRQTG